MKQLLCLALALFGNGFAAEKPVWLAVGPRPFLKSAEPLMEFRRGQGFEVVESSSDVPQAIKSCPRPPQFILLVGDCIEKPSDAAAAWHVPAATVPYYKWDRNDPDYFLTDMKFGDHDGDGVPEAAVGRFPARNATQVKAAVEKTLAWEARRPGLECLTMPVWTGDANYGPVFAKMAAPMFFSSINLFAPKWLDLWCINADTTHALCGHPGDHSQVFARRLRQGGVLSAMMGHGWTEHFWSMDVAGRSIVFDTSEAGKLTEGGPQAPHVIYACACGHFYASKDCLAEAMFAAPGGPVLCVAASTDSHPLTNYYTSTAMLRAMRESHATFGSLWVAAQRDARNRNEPIKEQLLAEVEGKLHGVMDTNLLKRDQMFMYNLLGDPAVSLRLPQRLDVTVVKETPSDADAAPMWRWNVKAPAKMGPLRVDFRPRFDKMFSPRPADLSAEEARKRFAEANATLAFRTVETKPAAEEWSGTHQAEAGTLRFVVESPEGIFAGGADLK